MTTYLLPQLTPIITPITDEQLAAWLPQAEYGETTVLVCPESVTAEEVRAAFDRAGGCSVDTAELLGAVLVDFEWCADGHGRATVSFAGKVVFRRDAGPGHWRHDSQQEQLLEALDEARTLVQLLTRGVTIDGWPIRIEVTFLQQEIEGGDLDGKHGRADQSLAT
jgi:hypothetical protein